MKLTSPESPLCGRAEERSRLAAVTKSGVGHSKGGVVVGASGLGKTRLLAAAAADAKLDGAVVLSGSCLDVGDSWPLHPLREAAEQIRTDYGDLAAVERLVEQLESRAPDEPNADIVAAAHIELAKLSCSKKLVLVIDDLQWVDSSTIRLVRTLLSGLTKGSLSFLGGLRTDLHDPANSSRLLVEFHSSPVVEVIELEPLDEPATRELARSVSDRPISPQRSQQLWRRSGGVPMLIKALASHDDTESDNLRSIRVVLASRINELTKPARDLLRVASLGVGPVDHEVAKTVLALTDDQLLQAAREAVSEGILKAVGSGYSPVHDLFREIIQNSMIEPERILLHRRIAESIESGSRPDDSDPVELAHHWAGANDGKRALPSFIEAARDATREGAFIEAWQRWQSVTSILSASSSNQADDADLLADDADLLADAAEAAHVVEEHVASLHLAEWAEKVEPDPGRQLRLRFARSRYLAGGGKLEVAESICSQIFDDPQTDPSLAVEAGAQSADLLTRLGRYEAAVERATATIERTRNKDADEVAKLLATSALGYSKACLGDPESARQDLAHALKQAVHNGSPRLIEAASRNYADLLMGPLNELEAGVALAEEQAQFLVDNGGEQRLTTSLLATATTGLFRLGRWQDACRAATAALESDPTGAGVIDLLLGRVRVVIGLGDFDAADRDLRTASSLLGSDPNPRHDLPLSTLRAGLAMWRHDIDTARQEIGSVIERADSQNIDDPLLLAPLVWHGLRAEALAPTPDVGWAFKLFVTMTDIRDESSLKNTDQANLLQSYFLLCAGELDRTLEQSRPGVWNKAAQAWDECGHPYPAAYARMHQAEAMFSERTRNSKAEAVLRSAYQSVDRLGAEPLAAQIRGLAKRARIDLNRSTGPADNQPEIPETKGKMAELTAREHEIIAELSQGLSNREIGERLYISGRTVGVHVSNILAKLGAKTRVEAAAVYVRETTNPSI